MPYISQENRRNLRPLTVRPIGTPGDLSYAISRLCQSYLAAHYSGGYTTMNDIIGALEGAKIEFYRRVVVPYEEDKIEENGDIY